MVEAVPLASSPCSLAISVPVTALMVHYDFDVEADLVLIVEARLIASVVPVM